jgi:hypothetical protein
MKLPILFIALLVQTALSDQIKDGHLRGVNNRQLPRERKHGHHGGHPHSDQGFKKGSSKNKGSKEGSKKGSPKGKKGWKKHSKGDHQHHWKTSSSSSSSSSSADTAIDATVELELINTEPAELAIMIMEPPTDEVEVVSTKTSIAKAAESLASVLVSDQIDRQLHSVSSSSEEEKTSFDNASSQGNSADTSLEEASESSSLESHSRKHGYHGGHPHSGHSHSWKHSKKGSRKGSKKGSHKGKKGWKKHSKGDHHHWETSGSSSSSSSTSADNAAEAVEVELIDTEPELAVMIMEPPTEEVEAVSTKTYVAKAAGSWASVLVGSAMQKPQVERTVINHGN